MPERLGPVLTLAECRRVSDKSDWAGDRSATYMLWNTRTGDAIYCGTAKNKGSLARHFGKDDLANAKLGLTKRNSELRSYWLSQAPGCLGISFIMSEKEKDAKTTERSIIARLGIRRNGGALYNQRMRG